MEQHHYGVRVAGPLVEHIDGFVAEVTGKGFSSKSISQGSVTPRGSAKSHVR